MKKAVSMEKIMIGFYGIKWNKKDDKKIEKEFAKLKKFAEKHITWR